MTITRSGPTTGTSTVVWSTADNGAEAGSDYVAVPETTLTFTPGVTTRTVAVTVNAGTVVKPNETLFVRLSSPSGATITDGSGQGVITSDDTSL